MNSEPLFHIASFCFFAKLFVLRQIRQKKTQKESRVRFLVTQLVSHNMAYISYISPYLKFAPMQNSHEVIIKIPHYIQGFVNQLLQSYLPEIKTAHLNKCRIILFNYNTRFLSTNPINALYTKSTYNTNK